MKLNKTFARVAIVAIGLFAASASPAQNSTNLPPTGAQTSSPRVRHNPTYIPQSIRKLGLNADQLAKITDLTEDRKRQEDAIIKDPSVKSTNKMVKITELSNVYKDKMKAILTPEQYEQWQKNRAQLKHSIVHTSNQGGLNATNTPSALP